MAVFVFILLVSITIMELIFLAINIIKLRFDNKIENEFLKDSFLLIVS